MFYLILDKVGRSWTLWNLPQSLCVLKGTDVGTNSGFTDDHIIERLMFCIQSPHVTNITVKCLDPEPNSSSETVQLLTMSLSPAGLPSHKPVHIKPAPVQRTDMAQPLFRSCPTDCEFRWLGWYLRGSKSARPPKHCMCTVYSLKAEPPGVVGPKNVGLVGTRVPEQCTGWTTSLCGPPSGGIQGLSVDSPVRSSHRDDKHGDLVGGHRSQLELRCSLVPFSLCCTSTFLHFTCYLKSMYNHRLLIVSVFMRWK